MNEECLICGAPLEYLQEEVLMECFFCHKKVRSLTRCVKGHYVCDECHSGGMDAMVSVCLNEKSKDPIDIVEKLMSQKFCHMHGPEHHTMVGAALLTAYRNAGGEVDLEKLAKHFDMDPSDMKLIQAKYINIGDEWVSIAGTSTGAWMGISLCGLSVLSVLWYRRKRSRVV